MNPVWLIFLALLTSAGTPRQYASPSEVLPESHLEDDEEEEDDAEENSNAEQSSDISASPPVSELYETEELLKKSAQNLQEYSKLLSIQRAEEERSQEQQAVESRFGPHYLSIHTESPSEEQSLDVSGKTDLLQRNPPEETSQEDLKANVTLAMLSTTLVFSLTLMVCCGVAFYKYRTQKGNTSNTFRCSPKQQRVACPRSDSSKSKTLPIADSIEDVSSISAESTHSSTPSYKALNADQN